jgi:hypothetical protein
MLINMFPYILSTTKLCFKKSSFPLKYLQKQDLKPICQPNTNTKYEVDFTHRFVISNYHFQQAIPNDGKVVETEGRV